MTYDAASQMSGIARFADLLGQQSIAASSYAYDLAGKLTRLTHRSSSIVYADYQWTYDAADRITQFVSPDGTSDYSYDNRGQLTGANNSSQPNEAYSYDANGNRTNAGYQTGANNQLLSDGTYSYTYDNEGNRISRTNIAKGEVTLYSWDYHNRLTSVVTQNGSGTVTESVAYTYDAYDRRIAKVIDPDGAGPATATTERMVYDGDNIALTFDGTGIQTHRYLYGSGVDQVLADETATSVNWALVDYQGTVRDVIDSNGTVLNHIVYDSYGQVTSETNASLDFRFGYTGRERDKETGLQYNRARYYDPSTGGFLSEDPMGFAAGDYNLSRYVFNSPLNAIDPSGNTSTQLIELLSVYSKPKAGQPTIYIFNQKFSDYSSASISAHNWFWDITDPSKPLEYAKKPPKLFPWVVTTALKGPTGRAILRPGARTGGSTGFDPTIQLIPDENGQYHNTPDHPASEVKFEWEGKKDDRCPFVLPAPKERPSEETKDQSNQIQYSNSVGVAEKIASDVAKGVAGAVVTIITGLGSLFHPGAQREI